MELVLLVATLAQHWAFRPVAGQPAVPKPLITLRPGNGVTMTLHRRNSVRAAVS